MKTIHTRIFLLAMLLLPGILNAQVNNNKKAMSVTEKNKQVVQNLYETSLNKGDLSLLHNFIADNYTGPLGEKGVNGFGANIAPLLKAFPGIYWKLEDLFGENDKVVARWKWQGTQTGQYRNIAPTGKTITNDGMAIYTLKDGKIISTQVQTDRLGFLQTLDVLPADLSSAPGKKTNEDAVFFIDKFFIPADAVKEFSDRMQRNRDLIKTQPGFVEDAVYKHTDNDGNLLCITVAQWANMDALNKAKTTVQAAYQQEGFDMAAMMKRLNISIDRGTYSKTDH